MALFKVARGVAANLPKKITDGYAYFTTDDGKFYIDANVTRTAINPTIDYTSNSGNSQIKNRPVQVTKTTDEDGDVFSVTFGNFNATWFYGGGAYKKYI